MIVSHEHRFIFLKTRKTAGTSVEMALTAVCGDRDVITKLIADDERTRREQTGRGRQNDTFPLRRHRPRDLARLAVRRQPRTAYHHMPAAEVRELVGPEVWDGYTKFSISRNPFDVAVSMYHWRGEHERMTFGEFLRTGNALDRIAGNHEIYSLDGEVAVDELLRFDDLAAGFEALCARLGLPGGLTLPRAKTTVRAAAGGRAEMFDAADRALVEQRCRAEIELMGYRFEG